LTSTLDLTNYYTCYTYDGNGNRTSTSQPLFQSDPQNPTCSSVTSTTQYNQYSEPTQTTDELGNTRTFNYDSNYNPSTVTDSLGTLASFQFNSDGTMAAGAVGYDINSTPAAASHFTYDADGNLFLKGEPLNQI
jgi:YD repeat-containing protein